MQSPRYPNQADGSVEGELAQTYETSPDRLTLTFKLRPNVKWDSRAPTSGRAIDTQDVLTSWKRYTALNPSAQDFLYNATTNPNAAVESVTAPDNTTIVRKLRKPDPTVPTLLAFTDHFVVLPKEADGGGLDARTTIRGAGPWLLDEYVPSSHIHYKKNPDYYVKDRPFFDRMERPFVTEYAQRLAQFRAGNIQTHVANAEDVIQTKKDVPEVAMYQADTFPANVGVYLSFGYEGDSPWKDVRMRQAVSMMVDREGMSSVIDNTESYAADGLDLPVGYNSVLAPGWGNAWLDPADDKKFGTAAKYYKLNLAEAKKLMTAAGFPNGVEFPLYFNQDPNYNATYFKCRDLYDAMLRSGGLQPKLSGNPYTLHLEQFHFGYLSRQFAAGEKTGFNGILVLNDRSYATPANYAYNILHRDGVAFHGATTDGKNAHLGDAKLNDIIEKALAEPDAERRDALIHDTQRYAAEQAYLIPKASVAKAYSLWWPAVSNYGFHNSYVSGSSIPAEQRINWWLDTTKAPVTKA